jgi:superfamily II DNA/RNA helicase
MHDAHTHARTCASAPAPQVAKLQRASLVNPVRVEVSSKYQTVSTLKSSYLFVPAKHKDVYFVHLMNEMAGSSVIVFTCARARRASCGCAAYSARMRGARAARPGVCARALGKREPRRRRQRETERRGEGLARRRL